MQCQSPIMAGTMHIDFWALKKIETFISRQLKLPCQQFCKKKKKLDTISYGAKMWDLSEVVYDFPAKIGPIGKLRE